MTDDAEFQTQIEAEQACVTFVRAWSEAVLRQVEDVKDIRRQNAIANRDVDRDYHSHTEEEMGSAWRRAWSEEHILKARVRNRRCNI